MKELKRLANFADRGTIITILYRGEIRRFHFETANLIDALCEFYGEFYPTICMNDDCEQFPMTVLRLWEKGKDLWYSSQSMLFIGCYFDCYFGKGRWTAGEFIDNLIEAGKDYKITSDMFKKAA